MAHITKVNGTAYEISGGKTKVNGTAYGIAGGRTKVGGTGYDISFGTPLSTLAVGNSVYMNVGGTPKEFIIVHKGNPDTGVYDASCDGVWVLMKEIYTTCAFDMSNNDYVNSDVHALLNGTFLSSLDASIQSAIKTVKIPYLKGPTDYGVSTTICQGANGLSTKVFCLSVIEAGTFPNVSRLSKIVSKNLDYFFRVSSTTDPNYQSQFTNRIAYNNGSACGWLVRDPYNDPTGAGSSRVWYVGTNGKDSYMDVYRTWHGARPCFILPHDVGIDGNFNVIA